MEGEAALVATHVIITAMASARRRCLALRRSLLSFAHSMRGEACYRLHTSIRPAKRKGSVPSSRELSSLPLPPGSSFAKTVPVGLHRRLHALLCFPAPPAVVNGITSHPALTANSFRHHDAMAESTAAGRSRAFSALAPLRRRQLVCRAEYPQSPRRLRAMCE